MKNIICFIMAFVLIFALAACGAKDAGEVEEVENLVEEPVDLPEHDLDSGYEKDSDEQTGENATVEEDSEPEIPIPGYKMCLVKEWENDGNFFAAYLIETDENDISMEPSVKGFYAEDGTKMSTRWFIFDRCYAGYDLDDAAHDQKDKNSVIAFIKSPQDFDAENITAHYMCKGHYEEELLWTINSTFDEMFYQPEVIHGTGIFEINGELFAPDPSVGGGGIGGNEHEYSNTYSLIQLCDDEAAIAALNGLRERWTVCYGESRRTRPEGANPGEIIPEAAQYEKYYSGNPDKSSMLPAIYLKIGVQGFDTHQFESRDDYPEWVKWFDLGSIIFDNGDGTSTYIFIN